MTTNHQVHKPNVGDHVTGYSYGEPCAGIVEKLMESPWDGDPVVIVRPRFGGSRGHLRASEIRQVRVAA